MPKWPRIARQRQLEATPFPLSIWPYSSEPVGSLECEKCISAGFLEKLNGHFIALSLPTHPHSHTANGPERRKKTGGMGLEL